MPRVTLPNVRKQFVPDDGYVLFDCDLSGADAQVFAKETGDEALLEDFRLNRDIHSDNATFMFGERFTSAPKDSYARKHMRQQCKHSVHATHNVGSPHALVRHPSIAFSMAEAERFQRNWFAKHPRIPEYFRRIEHQLATTRSVSNRFGYRIIYFDRVDTLLPKAIPWINQSTVAEVCFRGAMQVEEKYSFIEMLLQVHDSIVFQVPKRHVCKAFLKDLPESLKVPVPYPEPLIIPWKVSMSEKSWGDCEEVAT